VSSPGSLLRPDHPPKTAPSLIVRIDFARARLELTGQLDRHTAHVLHDAISTLLQTNSNRLIMNVAELTGLDPTGLRTIGATYRRALRHRRQLTLVGTPPFLQAALARLRLDQHVLASEQDIPARPTGSRPLPPRSAVCSQRPPKPSKPPEHQDRFRHCGSAN
jgi:anti-anti-sigma factor